MNLIVVIPEPATIPITVEEPPIFPQFGIISDIPSPLANILPVPEIEAEQITESIEQILPINIPDPIIEPNVPEPQPIIPIFSVPIIQEPDISIIPSIRDTCTVTEHGL